MSRALRLRCEPLAELTATELSAVAGGQAVPTIEECPLSGPYPTLPLNDCATNTIVTLAVTK